MDAQEQYPRRMSVAGGQQDRRNIYVSGDWEIDCARRELRAYGAAVPIGSRAFEIIEALVQSPGELVTKDDLMARVWSNAIVEENTLQVHISAIRKAFGTHRDMLKTVSGRGYRLLGKWSIREEHSRADPEAFARPWVVARPFQTNIPVAASALIGREAAVQQVRDLLSAYRVVTLTGPGGIGKTVLAAEIARSLFPTLASDVLLVELVSLRDPKLVPSAVASLLSLQLGGDVISAETVARAIGGKRFLLVLDNCEHVIDEAAKLAESVVRICPHASILATSREVLRIEGEFVYPVPPLNVPPHEQYKSTDVLQHSAVQLFIARTEAVGSDFPAREDNLAAIAEICRRLDGIPLAIEFAAARAATLGVREVAAHLNDRFALFTSGHRTALPRHQTLRSTLDWSHDLLPEWERRLLRRLAIFPAGFILEAAAAVMSEPVSGVAVGISNLVSKSLVALDGSVASGRWRLLETTRAYALEKLAESGEGEQAARRHAEFFGNVFAPAEAGSQPRLAVASIAREIDSVRAALDWSFSPVGDSAIGVALASATAPALFAMSLLAECHRWSDRAILALDDAARGGPLEMRLQGALGMSIIFTRGSSEPARAALTRGLAVAEERGDAENQLRLLSQLHMFYTRIGDFNTALQYARRAAEVVGAIDDPAAAALGHTVLGMALRHAGDLNGTRTELEAALQHRPISQWVNTFYVGYDPHNLASITLAICLLYQGYPVQAERRVYQTVQDAISLDHPVTLAIVLSWAIRVLLWIGNFSSAEEHIDWLLSHATSFSLRPYLVVAGGLKGELAIRRGDPTAGISRVQDCLAELHATRYGMLTTEFNIALVEGFRAIGLNAEAGRLIDDAIGLANANGAFSLMPELLRVKGRILVSMDPPMLNEAELCFTRSIELSQRQAARTWELRATIDLATLWVRRRGPDAARALLEPVFEQFDEGLDVADLRGAKQLLSNLSS